MKISPFLFVSVILSISAQSLSTNTKSIFKHDLLIGNWAFESMTTIKKAKREEIIILYKDNKNIETLHFKKSGSINYDVINDGVEKNGLGFGLLIKPSFNKVNLIQLRYI